MGALAAHTESYPWLAVHEQIVTSMSNFHRVNTTDQPVLATRLSYYRVVVP